MTSYTNRPRFLPFLNSFHQHSSLYRQLDFSNVVGNIKIPKQYIAFLTIEEISRGQIKLSKEDQIKGIKDAAIHSINSTEQIEAINTLSQYGNKAISSITEVIESSEDEKVKILGYKAIQKIKTHNLG